MTYPTYEEIKDEIKAPHNYMRLQDEDRSLLPFDFPYRCIRCGEYPTHILLIDGKGASARIVNHKHCGIMLKSNKLRELYERWNYVMSSFDKNLINGRDFDEDEDGVKYFYKQRKW